MVELVVVERSLLANGGSRRASLSRSHSLLRLVVEDGVAEAPVAAVPRLEGVRRDVRQLVLAVDPVDRDAPR